ncbi:MAG TPA: electron transfer flavoprotein-ubiquinone oxidoreductase [Steroidobacteraceae bacterium]|nr:electron transfer flavoprotein-ubiquinone oxidoreductase [Steroidobacteraceae bacterium]
MSELIERDVMNYDVIVVGAGPAGLACAIRLRQLDASRSVCVLEKGASVGAHLLSGALLDPAPLDALLPDWRATAPAICTPVAATQFRFLSQSGSLPLPTPPQQHGRGTLIVSIDQLMAQLALRAEGLGVDVFAGFAVREAVLDGTGAVAGVRLGDMGRARDGTQKTGFTPGADILAPSTVVAEGCRGSLTGQLVAHFGLASGVSAPTYGLGFKELWQLPPGRAHSGRVLHTVGWPLDAGSYGGGFVYHLPGDRVYVGYIVGLDYRDPRLAPFELFQRFKQHPAIAALLEGGQPLAYGARCVSTGGWQALPRLEMPGALLIGDAAGMLNVARLKGIDQAMASGVLAAEHLHERGSVQGFDERWRASAPARALWRVRNIKPAFKRGLWIGLGNAALETALRGHSPWTLRMQPDFASLRRLDQLADALAPPAPGQSPELPARTLPPRDRTAAVYLSATDHREDQPVHLHVLDPTICSERCSVEYGNPCTRFCPAAVYEIVTDEAGARRLQINAANCVHCKACDIKDPYEIIHWTVPEGGSGPNYQDL